MYTDMMKPRNSMRSRLAATGTNQILPTSKPTWIRASNVPGRVCGGIVDVCEQYDDDLVCLSPVS